MQSDPDAGLRGSEKLSAVITIVKCRWAYQWNVSKEICRHLHEKMPMCNECEKRLPGSCAMFQTN